MSEGVVPEEDVAFSVDVGKIEGAVICPICYNVMDKPTMAFNCGHTYCEGCVRNLVNCSLCKGFIMTRVRNYALQTVIDSMQKRCRFCSQLYGGDLLNHVKSGACAGGAFCADCLVVYQGDHAEVCPNRKVACPGCGSVVVFSDNRHKLICPGFGRCCEACGYLLKDELQENRLTNGSCKMRLWKCACGATTELDRGGPTLHMKQCEMHSNYCQECKGWSLKSQVHDCPMTVVGCPFGCNAAVVRDTASIHKLWDCQRSKKCLRFNSAKVTLNIEAPHNNLDHLFDVANARALFGHVLCPAYTRETALLSLGTSAYTIRRPCSFCRCGKCDFDCHLGCGASCTRPRACLKGRTTCGCPPCDHLRLQEHNFFGGLEATTFFKPFVRISNRIKGKVVLCCSKRDCSGCQLMMENATVVLNETTLAIQFQGLRWRVHVPSDDLEFKMYREGRSSADLDTAATLTISMPSDFPLDKLQRVLTKLNQR